MWHPPCAEPNPPLSPVAPCNSNWRKDLSRAEFSVVPEQQSTTVIEKLILPLLNWTGSEMGEADVF